MLINLFKIKLVRSRVTQLSLTLFFFIFFYQMLSFKMMGRREENREF